MPQYSPSTAEPFSDFCRRYAERQAQLQPLLETFGADALRHYYAHGWHA